jgi:hypothetical protein
MMFFVYLLIAFIVLPKLGDIIKIGSIVIIGLLQFLVTYGVIPFMFWMLVELNSKGN